MAKVILMVQKGRLTRIKHPVFTSLQVTLFDLTLQMQSQELLSVIAENKFLKIY